MIEINEHTPEINEVIECVKVSNINTDVMDYLEAIEEKTKGSYELTVLDKKAMLITAFAAGNIQGKREEKRNDRMIDKDKLLEAALIAENSAVILGDILEDFFCNLNIVNSENRTLIVNEIRRYRAYAHVCFDMVHRLTQELHKHGIYCFSD